MKRFFLVLILFSTPFTTICSQNLDELSLKYAKASFTELYEFFSLPNNAYNPEDIEPNVKWCENAFQKRGFKTQRLKTETVPLLLATRDFPNAKKQF